MRYIIALVLCIAAYAVFDIGYNLSNHILSLFVKSFAGSLFSIAGVVLNKEDKV